MPGTAYLASQALLGSPNTSDKRYPRLENVPQSAVAGGLTGSIFNAHRGLFLSYVPSSILCSIDGLHR
jgi:hypothetical protein